MKQKRRLIQSSNTLSTNEKTIQVIIGPTASGKSAFALSKAKDLNGVIINCDAMQSYDALHILTAQPSVEEQKSAPHCLYGHLHPATHYSAADWRADALREIELAWSNEQTPILCGGTGFYLKALTDGLSPIPEIPLEIREEANILQKKLGNPAFHLELKKRDFKSAEKLDPMNTQRNIRAWEVYEYTKKPLAEWQKEPMVGAPAGWSFHKTALIPNRENLIKKINLRLNVMIELGIIDEVKALNDHIRSGDVPDNALIVKAHGFRPFRKYINNELSLNDAIDQTQIETRQYAKRQITWIRNQLHIDHIIEIP